MLCACSSMQSVNGFECCLHSEWMDLYWFIQCVDGLGWICYIQLLMNEFGFSGLTVLNFEVFSFLCLHTKTNNSMRIPCAFCAESVRIPCAFCARLVWDKLDQYIPNRCEITDPILKQHGETSSY